MENTQEVCYNKDTLKNSTKPKKKPVLSPEKKAQLVAKVASDNKALNLKIFNVEGHSAFADYFVVMSATSTIHAQGLADSIFKEFPKGGSMIEGYQNAQWILLDVRDVIIHIFLEDARLHYNFDKLWGHVPVESIDDDALLNEAGTLASSS